MSRHPPMHGGSMASSPSPAVTVWPLPAILFPVPHLQLINLFFKWCFSLQSSIISTYPTPVGERMEKFILLRDNSLGNMTNLYLCLWVPSFKYRKGYQLPLEQGLAILILKESFCTYVQFIYSVCLIVYIHSPVTLLCTPCFASTRLDLLPSELPLSFMV